MRRVLQPLHRVLLLAGGAVVATSIATAAPAGKRTRETKTAIAYAENESAWIKEVTDKKEIEIPANCRYLGHTTKVTTANPREEDLGRWTRGDGVKKKGKRISAAWVVVKAGRKDVSGTNVWIGVELSVQMECVAPPKGDAY